MPRGRTASGEASVGTTNKRSGRNFSSRYRSASVFAIAVLTFCLFIAIGRTQRLGTGLFSLSAFNSFSFSSASLLTSDQSESQNLNSSMGQRDKRKNIYDASTNKSPFKLMDRRGVQEPLTTVRQDWKMVISSFLDDAPVESFSARNIRGHYNSDTNNVKNTCMLVTINDGRVTFTENYPPNRNSREPSAKYIIDKIVREKGKSLAGVTFLVMLTDGHQPQVATLGSARHWKNWKMMIPVPLGNMRGYASEWGTPLDGWNKYIAQTVVDTHKNYPWKSKINKAVFRGVLGMQRYKLGSCNEENGWQCQPASKWNEVNRGVLYQKTKRRSDLFDIAFTGHKPKKDGPEEQFEGIPKVGSGLMFADFQKYKYVLNVGSNQGTKYTRSMPAIVS